MVLHAGDRIGPYQIDAPIGAGGMGEVYRARDTKLGRDIAIKILPPAFTSDTLESLPGGPMQLFTRLRFAFVLVSLALVSSASHVVAQRRVMTTITRLYTGADGQSHAEDTEVAWRPARLRAELNESESVKVTAAQFLRWPRGFVWDGHPASRRQYVIIISGRGEVDVVGARKVQLAPGRVLLAEDVTGKGHTTRVGADEDLVMLLVPLAQEP